MKILVANKSDLPEQEVTVEEGQHLAREAKMEFYVTSAMTGSNVEEMFEDVVQKVITK